MSKLVRRSLGIRALVVVKNHIVRCSGLTWRVTARLRQHGRNTFARAPARSELRMLLQQFESLPVALLGAAALRSFATAQSATRLSSSPWSPSMRLPKRIKPDAHVRMHVAEIPGVRDRACRSHHRHIRSKADVIDRGAD